MGGVRVYMAFSSSESSQENILGRVVGHSEVIQMGITGDKYRLADLASVNQQINRGAFVGADPNGRFLTSELPDHNR